jgi:hypothetical protein
MTDSFKQSSYHHVSSFEILSAVRAAPRATLPGRSAFTVGRRWNRAMLDESAVSSCGFTITTACSPANLAGRCRDIQPSDVTELIDAIAE